MAIGTLVFDRSPYKNVIVLGHVQDKIGQKMSKHKGNVISPWDVLNKQGADAARWYFYISGAPWLPSRLYDEAVSDAQRKFMGTLWNTYAFYTLYAEIDKFNPTEYSLDYASLPIMDRWVLSKLHSLIKGVDERLLAYEVTEAARMLLDFADELSNWYVRRCRERFWQKGMEQDKVNAYLTLYQALTDVAKLAAPFIPFCAEAMYLNLVRNIKPNAPISVHLCDYPVCNPEWIDPSLEREMDLALRIVQLGRAARNEAAVKNRQPLPSIYVKAEAEPKFSEIILGELNIKSLITTDDMDVFVDYNLKPQLKTVGPKYGKLLPKIKTALKTPGLMGQLKSSGCIAFDIDGQNVTLTEADLLIESTHKQGFQTAEDKGVTVALDTNLTPELMDEGFVREFVSKVQTMRKEAGFEVTDRIRLYYMGSGRVNTLLKSKIREISEDVLASEAINNHATASSPAYYKAWSLNGEPIRIWVEKYDGFLGYNSVKA